MLCFSHQIRAGASGNAGLPPLNRVWRSSFSDGAALFKRCKLESIDDDIFADIVFSSEPQSMVRSFMPAGHTRLATHAFQIDEKTLGQGVFQ